MTQTEQQPLKTCEFLRPAEAAKYLRVSRTTIWRWARDDLTFQSPFDLAPLSPPFAEPILMLLLHGLRHDENGRN